VVYRAFGRSDAIAVGRTLMRVARRRGVRLIVGADAALAARLGADGLHLPERAAHRRGQILAWRRRFVVTAAAHDARAIRRARLAGAQAVVVSPVFPSNSPSAGRPLGALAFRTLVQGAGAPVYALGGVDLRTARRLAGSGAVGFAAVDAIAQAKS
jgi:thiamine-phosphate pyrophosphorylase